MTIHPAAAGGRHLHPVRVYYEDTDAGGVVYHATYLRYAERARTEALRDMAVPHAELVSQHGLMFMVRRVKVDYLAAARLDDSLLVVTEPLEVGAATATLRQSFVRHGEPERTLVALDIQLACVRVADQRPARMPPRWRDALRRMAEGLENASSGAH
jgi:acyl-CoA thioester hydrolase